MAVGDQKGQFLFVCYLHVSENAAGWQVVLHPENSEIRELQIRLASSILHLQTPTLAGKSELKKM